MSKPSTFKITTSQIPGYANGVISLQVNAPGLLLQGGDYKGSGRVLVAFDSTGRIIGMLYIDQLRRPDAGQVLDLQRSARLQQLPGYAFTETMFASEFGTVAFESLLKLTELWPGVRSNVGLTGSIALSTGEVSQVLGGMIVDGGIYTVHLYRVMRLRYDAIAAPDAETAANLARELCERDTKPSEISDCDGEIVSALVDVDGDDDYEQSEVINFTSSTDFRDLARELHSLLSSIAAAGGLSVLEDQDAAVNLLARSHISITAG